jgi:hypothetical protein
VFAAEQAGRLLYEKRAATRLGADVWHCIVREAGLRGAVGEEGMAR